MTDAPRHLTRTMSLPTGWAEKCDGCAAVIPKGTVAFYRLDGALFHDAQCAAIHDGIPLETKVTQEPTP